MKKLFALILALSLVLSLAACGAKETGGAEDTPDTDTSAPAEQSSEPSPAEESKAPAPAAPTIYTYAEDRGDFSIDWTITLYEAGNFILSETHGLSGETTDHTGAEWVDNGDGTITTGAWDDSSGNKSEFFKPNGECTWTVNADRTCEPVVEEGAEGGSESEDGIQPGKYTYEEDRGDFKVTWDVLLMGNGQFRLDETHGLSGEVTSHTGAEWVDNGDGTATTGAWDDTSANKSEFFAADGSCTWTINSDGTAAPVA